MQEIAGIIKKCEDDFEIIHGLGKLEIFDEMTEKNRSYSVSTPHGAMDKLIKVSYCFCGQLLTLTHTYS